MAGGLDRGLVGPGPGPPFPLGFFSCYNLLMARLRVLPHQDIIDGFKGKIDFYIWKGIPCARKWPVWRPRAPTPEEKANQDDFTRINQAAIGMPVEFIDAYRTLAQGTPFTWKDLMVRSFMRGLWR